MFLRYRSVSLTEAYMTFCFKEEISFSTFCKKINKIYKKPHRLSDKCDHCEFGKALKREIMEASVYYNYINKSPFDEFNLKDIKKFFIALKKHYSNDK